MIFSRVCMYLYAYLYVCMYLYTYLCVCMYVFRKQSTEVSEEKIQKLKEKFARKKERRANRKSGSTDAPSS